MDQVHLHHAQGEADHGQRPEEVLQAGHEGVARGSHRVEIFANAERVSPGEHLRGRAQARVRHLAQDHEVRPPPQAQVPSRALQGVDLPPGTAQGGQEARGEARNRVEEDDVWQHGQCFRRLAPHHPPQQAILPQAGCHQARHRLGRRAHPLQEASAVPRRLARVESLWQTDGHRPQHALPRASPRAGHLLRQVVVLRRTPPRQAGEVLLRQGAPPEAPVEVVLHAVDRRAKRGRRRDGRQTR